MIFHPWLVVPVGKESVTMELIGKSILTGGKWSLRIKHLFIPYMPELRIIQDLSTCIVVKHWS